MQALIVSASRRTDIPAFFGDWFVARLQQGYFHRINPFNPRQVKRFSLLPQDVDAIVFWTKDPSPFIRHLDLLDRMGFNYYFQYTLNAYPTAFEPKLPALERRLNAFQLLSRRLGPERVIWRYDPIILSSITPVDFHLRSMEQLAGSLRGCTERLTISCLDFYGKVAKRLHRLELEQGITVSDITRLPAELRQLAVGIRDIADKYGLQAFTCSEALDLRDAGIFPGACVDAALIRRLFPGVTAAAKDPNQRPECLCAAAVDVGGYDTCSFQCAYCYANHSPASVQANLRRHHADSPALIGGPDGQCGEND